ncbi:MAG: GDSL-type esterase/lipase family protein [Bacteroidales bacterium]|nr:GDSL-type esterase/lipase family protein [Bacteroidales bacterium]
MKRICFVFGILMLVAMYTHGADTNKKTVSESIDFHVRGGLPNFFQAIQNNRSVHISYLGGSITAAQNGWRELTYNWLRVQYPCTLLTHNSAAIGGTGSNLGVFRTDHDVVSNKPDLVFVEFAVNDGGKPRAAVIKTMEGIVRKIWTANPKADICFVYTVDKEKIGKLINGELDSAVKAMEEVAEHYGIPTIHMGYDVMKLLQQGKLVFTAGKEENKNKIVFTTDNVHPLSESGHPIYAHTITGCFSRMSSFAIVKPHVLSTPIFNDNWEKAKVIDIADIINDGQWKRMPDDAKMVQSYSSFLNGIYTGKPGSKIQFSFKGTVLGLFDFVGPKSPVLNVTVDGVKKEVMRFDAHATYERLAYTVLFDELTDQVHQVEITVSDKTINKADIFKNSPGNLKILNDTPQMFNGIEYNIGGILMVGAVVK